MLSGLAFWLQCSYAGVQCSSGKARGLWGVRFNVLVPDGCEWGFPKIGVPNIVP